MTRGYELDASAKDANARANQSSVELERATTREIANQERIAELRTRAAAGSAELEQARLHLQGLVVERESHRLFLENAAAEAAGVREESKQRQEQARDASEAVTGAEQRLESARRYAMQLLTQAGHARNQTMHAEESSPHWSRMRNGSLQRSALPARSLPRWARNADRLHLNSNQSLSNCNASRANSSPCAQRARRGAAKRVQPSSKAIACAPRWQP